MDFGKLCLWEAYFFKQKTVAIFERINSVFHAKTRSGKGQDSGDKVQCQQYRQHAAKKENQSGKGRKQTL